MVSFFPKPLSFLAMPWYVVVTRVPSAADTSGWLNIVQRFVPSFDLGTKEVVRKGVDAK